MSFPVQLYDCAAEALERDENIFTGKLACARQTADNRLIAKQATSLFEAWLRLGLCRGLNHAELSSNDRCLH